MSYDTTIFFAGAPATLPTQNGAETATLISGVTGLQVIPARGRGSFEARGFGIEFWLHPRHPFAKEIEREDITALPWQLELSSGSASGIIHPVSFWLAQQLSATLGSTCVLTLSGIEILAGVFVNGVLTVDRLDAAQDRVSKVGWRLASRVKT